MHLKQHERDEMREAIFDCFLVILVAPQISKKAKLGFTNRIWKDVVGLIVAYRNRIYLFHVWLNSKWDSKNQAL